MNPAKTQSYLPNLDALRAIAALSVIIHHCDNPFVATGLKQYYTVYPFGFGSLAVVLFFTLSGFLITYLLLREKDTTGTISMRNFYARRILRIWPLYFVILILAFGFFNHHPFWEWPGVTDKIELYKRPLVYALLLLLICPNIVLTECYGLGYAGQTWSIGIEEQFYLIWPWLMRRRNPLFYVVATILVVYLLSQGFIKTATAGLTSIGLLHEQGALYHFADLANKFFTNWARFRIDCMAIGALGAFAVLKGRQILPLLYSRRFQLLVYVLTALLMIFPHAADDRLYALLFMFIIVNLATNPHSLLRLENRALNYLGKISYGMYMYHSMAVIPAFYVATKVLHLGAGLVAVLTTFFITTALTIAASALSYHFLESYFLRQKDRFVRKKKASASHQSSEVVA